MSLRAPLTIGAWQSLKNKTRWPRRYAPRHDRILFKLMMRFNIYLTKILKFIVSKTFWHYFLLAAVLALSLVLRIYFSWDSVFQEPIRYAADDGVYHMRLIENMLLGGHDRLFFDP